MGQPWPLFVGFRSFQKGILQKKTVGFNGFRTWIVGVEGKHTDHLTTTSLAPIQIQIYSEICTFENAGQDCDEVARPLENFAEDRRSDIYFIISYIGLQ